MQGTNRIYSHWKISDYKPTVTTVILIEITILLEYCFKVESYYFHIITLWITPQQISIHYFCCSRINACHYNNYSSIYGRLWHSLQPTNSQRKCREKVSVWLRSSLWYSSAVFTRNYSLSYNKFRGLVLQLANSGHCRSLYHL